MQHHPTRPAHLRAFRALRRLIAAVLTLALVLGPGAPGTAAQPTPPTPTLQTVTVVSATALGIKWSYAGEKPEGSYGVRVNYYLPDGKHVGSTIPTPASTFDFTAIHETGVSIAPLKLGGTADARLCIGVQMFVGTGREGSSTFSEESERKCAGGPDVLVPSTGDGGPAIRPAQPSTPSLTAIRADSPTTLLVSWDDVSEVERVDGLRVNVYDEAGAFHSARNVTPPVGGRMDASGQMPYRDLEPNTRYCVGLKTWAGDGEDAATVFSEETERRCITMPALALQPADLLVEAIRGRDEREWSQVRGQTPAYLIVLRNEGADADGNVTVEIQTSGVASLAEQPAVVKKGWENNGFTCASMPVSGGASSGLRCTGGSLKGDKSVSPAVNVQFTRAGFGNIHVSVKLTGGQSDAASDNNNLTLPVRIY